MPLSASILFRLLHQHETISELIAGFSEKQLRHAVQPGKWSAFENIAHLAAYQPNHIHRVTLILESEHPRFERYVAENDPLFYSCLKKSLPELLDDINNKRSIMIDLLTGLTEKQLKLIGLHARYGPMTVSQWMDFFLLHEAHHLWTIWQLTSVNRAERQE